MRLMGRAVGDQSRRPGVIRDGSGVWLAGLGELREGMGKERWASWVGVLVSETVAPDWAARVSTMRHEREVVRRSRAVSFRLGLLSDTVR
jgi:hypothetical protein